MTTLTVYAEDTESNLAIGRVGENGVTEVVFYCASFIETYGSGTAEIIHKRPGESVGYVCQGVVQDGETVTWTVDSDDTAYSGQGKLQLKWVVDDAIKKTALFDTFIYKSIDSSESAPVEVQDALAIILQYVQDNCIELTDLDNRIANYFDDHPLPVDGLDTELKDIRVGADSTVYPSAGNAVRGQISDIKEDLNDTQDVVIIKDAGINIGDLVVGNTVNSTTGANTSINYGTRTNYVDFNIPVLIRFSFDLNTYQYDIFTYSSHAVANVVANPTNSKWANESRMFVFVPDGTAPCMRIGIRRKDRQTMTTDMTDPTSDFYKIASGIKLYRVTDTSLSSSGIPADAKATKTAIDTATGLSASLTVDKRSAMQSGDDLNNYMTPGNYYATITTVTSPLLNIPDGLTTAFMLFVFTTINSGRVIQIVQESSLTSHIYKRYYNGSTWTSWTRLITDQDVDVNRLNAHMTDSNILSSHSAGTTTSNGITVKSDGVGTYKISGTATANTIYNIYNNTSALPSGFRAGETYRVKVDIPSLYAHFRVIYYVAGEGTTVFDSAYDGTFTLPNNAEGLIIRLFFYKNGLNSPEFEVHPQIFVDDSIGYIESIGEKSYYPPMLTIIDDDGYGYFHRDLMPLCVAKNVSISSAVVTGYMGVREGYMTWEQVQECYAAGCEILSHGYNHKTDAAILEDGTTAEELEKWYRMAKHDLELHGIKSDILVFNNNTGNVIQCQQAARRVYKAAIHAAGAEINAPTANPYYIKRFNFTAGSHDEPHTLQEMKDNIDALVSAGTGWDCWMIHTSSTGGWSADEVAKLGDAIDYARSKGVLVVTCEYAMRYYYGLT